MGFFKNLLKKKDAAAELKPVTVAKPGTGWRLGKQKKHKYKAEFALVYNGRPVGKISVTEEGYSRDMVAKKLSEGMGVKLISVVQLKENKKDSETSPTQNH